MDYIINTNKIQESEKYDLIDYAEFTWEAFIYSKTALENSLCNEPDEKVKEAIRELVSKLLEPLRMLYGKAIRITSGYRSPEVNRLVRGIPDSQHTKGEAADLFIPEGPEYLLYLLVNARLDFDQAIVYHQRYFLHLSYTATGINRHEILYR